MLAPVGPAGIGSGADWHFPLESDLGRPMAWEGLRGPQDRLRTQHAIFSCLGAWGSEGSGTPRVPEMVYGHQELLLWRRWTWVAARASVSSSLGFLICHWG